MARLFIKHGMSRSEIRASINLTLVISWGGFALQCLAAYFEYTHGHMFWVVACLVVAFVLCFGIGMLTHARRTWL